MSRTRAATSSLAHSLGDIPEALEGLALPLFIVGTDREVKWLNRAARSRFPSAVGGRFDDVAAPESKIAVRDAFLKKIVGNTPSTQYPAVFLRPDGTQVHVEVNSVPLKSGHRIVGVFGAVVVGEPAKDHAGRATELTPRQSQTLGLLARGCSTSQIASEMGVVPETVRNHVRELLRKLGAHSRLEAVLIAEERGLINPEDRRRPVRASRS